MRILIVEDHPIMRGGLKALVQSHWPDAEVLESENLEKAEAVARKQTLDCMTLDLSLPDASGMEILIRMRRIAPNVPVLIMSMHAEEAYAIKSLQMGASAYLNKERAGEELIVAMKRVLAGGQYITSTLAEQLAGFLTGGKSINQLPHESLSSQEYRVMIQLANGKEVGQIAEYMHLSVKTVSTYRSRIMEKMNLKTNSELTRYCLSNGLLSD